MRRMSSRRSLIKSLLLVDSNKMIFNVGSRRQSKRVDGTCMYRVSFWKNLPY
jgi:hypothetical protein